MPAKAVCQLRSRPPVLAQTTRCCSISSSRRRRPANSSHSALGPRSSVAGSSMTRSAWARQRGQPKHALTAFRDKLGPRSELGCLYRSIGVAGRFLLWAGPRVRILFPPAASQVRTPAGRRRSGGNRDRAGPALLLSAAGTSQSTPHPMPAAKCAPKAKRAATPVSAGPMCATSGAAAPAIVDSLAAPPESHRAAGRSNVFEGQVRPVLASQRSGRSARKQSARCRACRSHPCGSARHRPANIRTRC